MLVFYYLFLVFEVTSYQRSFFPRKIVIFSLYFHFHRILIVDTNGQTSLKIPTA